MMRNVYGFGSYPRFKQSLTHESLSNDRRCLPGKTHSSRLLYSQNRWRYTSFKIIRCIMRCPFGVITFDVRVKIYLRPGSSLLKNLFSHSKYTCFPVVHQLCLPEGNNVSYSLLSASVNCQKVRLAAFGEAHLYKASGGSSLQSLRRLIFTKLKLYQ